MKFAAIEGPAVEQAARHGAELDPTNPFNTPEYVAFRRSRGEQPVVFTLESEGLIVAACSGFVKSGRISSQMEIPSVPSVPETSPFWQEMHQWCRDRRVWDLHLNSFGSKVSDIPHMQGEVARQTRSEYVLDLTPEDPLSRLQIKHKQTINKALKCGVTMRRTKEADACDIHAGMVTASLDRRETRGEQTEQTPIAIIRGLIASGAGEFFQACRDGVVVSSSIILHGLTGSYYQSAGTSPQGLECGASAFLIAEVARMLKQDGRVQFNLGGADQEKSGLQKFKMRFGCDEVPLQNASFSLVPPVIQQARKAASRIITRFK